MLLGAEMGLKILLGKFIIGATVETRVETQRTDDSPLFFSSVL